MINRIKSRTLGLGVELEEIGSELITEWFIAEDPPKASSTRKTRPADAEATPPAVKPSLAPQSKSSPPPEPPHAS